MPKHTKTQTPSRSAMNSRIVVDTPTPAMLAPLAVEIAGKNLTKKQRDFAKHVADGATGADAYRKSYNSKGKPETVADSASKLRKHPQVAQTIEAMQRAKELADSLSAAQIRALILSDLVKHSQDEEAKLSDRLTAMKMLGQLTDIGAFTERKEVLTVKASVDIKTQLMERLKLIANSEKQQADSNKLSASSPAEDDADSLLDELRNDPNVIDGELVERGQEFNADSDKLIADSE